MSLLRADSVALPLADESVDLVVTSPPYFALRSYTDGGEHYAGQIGSEATPQEFLDALWAVTAECKRVLKPSGSMFVNLGDKYAGSGGHNNAGLSSAGSTLQGTKQQDRTGMTAEQRRASRRQAPDSYNKASDVRDKSLMGLPWLYVHGCTGALAALGGPDPGLDLIHRAEIVWSKRNGMPESVRDRVRRSHEQWFHLTKDGDYFAAVDELREPHAPSTEARCQPHRSPPGAAARAGGYGQPEHSFEVEHMMNPLGKLPGSVWEVSTEPLRVPTFVDGAAWWLDTAAQRRQLWRYAELRDREGLPADVLEVDHFAAFPQEWPRRFILGWSPSGICVECGAGRAPVVERETTGENNNSRQGIRVNHMDLAGDAYRQDLLDHPRQITGYACACPEPSAPTRPAVVLDPFGGTGTVAMVARALGRFPVHVDLSADYLRLARWRVFESGAASKSTAKTMTERQGALL